MPYIVYFIVFGKKLLHSVKFVRIMIYCSVVKDIVTYNSFVLLIMINFSRSLLLSSEPAIFIDAGSAGSAQASLIHDFAILCHNYL